MEGNIVEGRQKKKKRAETAFNREKEPGNNFRCLPGEFDVTTSTDTRFPAASPPKSLYPMCPHPTLYYRPSVPHH